MIKEHFIGICMVVFFSGCIKDELPVPSRPAGEARAMTLCIGAAGQHQLWVDLSSLSVVSTNPKTAWDLAFESSADGWRIMLNGSRGMSAWDLGPVDITQPADTNGMGAQKKIDAPSGHADSTATGDWRSLEHVFVIDLGFNANGASMGLRKIRPLSVDGTSYTFEIADIQGGDLQTVILPKDPSRTFTHYSFANGPQEIGPVRGAWDLVFTQYTHQFYDPYLAYIVSGVLTDGRTHRVARVTGRDFSGVTLADTLSNGFSTARNAIGYDWKDYSFDTNSYTVFPGITYIIRTPDGFYHKLRFLDFYDDNGQAGCPSFEVVGF